MNEYSDISDEEFSSSVLENREYLVSDLNMSSGNDLGSGAPCCEAPGVTAGVQDTASAAAAAITTTAAATISTTAATTGPNCSTVGPCIYQAGPSTVPAFSAGLPPSSLPAGTLGHQSGLSYGIPQSTCSVPTDFRWTPPATTAASLGNVGHGSFQAMNFAAPPAAQSLPPGLPQMPPSAMPTVNPWLFAPTAMHQYRFPAPMAPWDMMPAYNNWPYFMPPMVSSMQYASCVLAAIMPCGIVNIDILLPNLIPHSELWSTIFW